MKDYILSNTVGIDHTAGYAIATRDRAFLDRVYVSKDYHFDNLANLNWDKVFKILPIYHNQRLDKKFMNILRATKQRQFIKSNV